MHLRKLLSVLSALNSGAAAAGLLLGLSQHAAATEPSGPDVLGVRVGMTHAEALAVLRTRAPKENWQTISTTLQFQNSRQDWTAVPGGTFRAVLLEKKQRIVNESPDSYLVYFSPTPGNERVVAFELTQIYVQQRPLLKDLTAQLVEKFGKPGEAQYDTQFTWGFDTKGAPRPLSQDQSGAPCRHVQRLADPKQWGGPSWSIDYNPMGQINRKPVDLVSACGAFMVRARIIQSGEGFVTSLNLELIGHELATAGKAAALKQIEEAKAGELAGARDAAKKGPKATF
ncbi:MAG: hypothetical protein Q8K96_06920 [Rubrivivax sp.]|nr:hypothetical protein [Rubrivivax sp.]